MLKLSKEATWEEDEKKQQGKNKGKVVRKGEGKRGKRRVKKVRSEMK